MHHPLLESVSLDNAPGIIANFTGGEDLTLYEVQEALSYLQEQTHAQTEIVMGVINDERMQDRVQITLVVTGLGAPTLEEALSNVTRLAKPEAKPEKIVERHISMPPAIEEEPQPAESLPQAVTLVPSQNLDLPAFLRRRNRY
jgi:cell division protein FtsZ